jgi:hypothetical protein
MRKICLAVLLVPVLAWAQPKPPPRTAVEWYKEGENQYILGNFDKAVEAFKQGFSLETDEDKRAKYVFNIAQSYRQANDCAKAHFFYKRFLALKANPKVTPLDPQRRQEVEDRIKDLEACAQQAALISKRPPDSLPGEADGEKAPAGGGDTRKDTHEDVRKQVAGSGNPPAGNDDDERTDTGEPKLGSARPHVFSARVIGGGTKFKMGPTVDVPIQAAFALIAGYPIPLNDKATVDAGVAATLTPVPYSVRDPSAPNMMGPKKTALLTGAMVNAGVSYEVMPKLSVRGDVGVGVLFFSNVSESRFTAGKMATGALSMFHLRIAPSVDYAFTPNIIGTIMPIAFTYSPPKKGLDDTIKNITSLDFFMVGIGYRM